MNRTVQLLQDSKVDVMNQLASTPSLSPIENLWGELMQQVYAEYKQYEDVESLKNAVAARWDRIDAKTCKNPVKFIQIRSLKVVEKPGGRTSYYHKVYSLVAARIFHLR